MAPSCVVTPVAPSPLRVSGAAVTTVASVTVTLGRTSFVLGPLPVVRPRSPLEVVGIATFDYWCRFPRGASVVTRPASPAV